MVEITWIKLKTDMFNSTKIRLIENLPQGDTILVMWIKLLTAAGKANCNGYIMLTENIPMNVEEMAVIFGRPLNTVRFALEAFKRYGMIEMDENEVVRIANWEKHQNIDGMEHVKKLNAERNKRYRERKKQQQLAATKTAEKEDEPKENPPFSPNDTNDPMRDVTFTSRDETDLDVDSDKDEEGQSFGQSLPHKDNDFLEIRNFFEQNVQVTTLKDCEKINEAMELYEKLLILEAIKAGASSARSFNYILGILDNWCKESNVKTYADWQLKIQQKGGSSNGGNSKRNVQRSNSEYDGLSL